MIKAEGFVVLADDGHIYGVGETSAAAVSDAIKESGLLDADEIGRLRERGAAPGYWWGDKGLQVVPASKRLLDAVRRMDGSIRHEIQGRGSLAVMDLPTMEVDGITIRYAGGQNEADRIKEVMDLVDQEDSLLYEVFAVKVFPGVPEWHETQHLSTALARLHAEIEDE